MFPMLLNVCKRPIVFRLVRKYFMFICIFYCRRVERSWDEYTLFFLQEQFYKNTIPKIGAENNGENNDLLFRIKENLRTTTP